MIVVLCTDAERDLILAGARHLVVPGDPDELCTHSHADWLPCPIPHVAPQRWLDATGPCSTCGGVHEWMQNWPGPNDLGRIKKVCPDCIDGRKRVALAVPCPWCKGEGRVWDEPDDTPMAGQRSAGWRQCNRLGCYRREGNTGSVVFAHATVEVLPVYELDGSRDALIREEAHAWVNPNNGLMIWRPGRTEAPLWDRFDSSLMAVPGRDWVVVLDNVEAA